MGGRLEMCPTAHSYPGGVRTRWWSARAIRLHLVLLVVVPTFLALCDWQVHRALAGNGLSWAYVFEWPFFAGYAVFVWWKLVHETLGPTNAVLDEERPSDERGAIEPTPDEDAALAAYNRYLGELHERGRPKRW
jgi:hypothetical protein